MKNSSTHQALFNVHRTLTAADISAETGFHEKIVRGWCNDSECRCPHSRRGRKLYFNSDEVADYIDRLWLEPGSGRPDRHEEYHRRNVGDGFWQRHQPYQPLPLTLKERLDRRLKLMTSKDRKRARRKEALAYPPELCTPFEREIITGERTLTPEQVRKLVAEVCHLRADLSEVCEWLGGWLQGHSDRREIDARLRAAILNRLEYFATYRLHECGGPEPVEPVEDEPNEDETTPADSSAQPAAQAAERQYDP